MSGDQNDTRKEKQMQEAQTVHGQREALGKLLSEATTRTAQSGINILLAINGGAAVALLTFIGGLMVRMNITVSDISTMVSDLGWFTGGVGSATIVAMFTYLTDFFYAGAAISSL